MRKLRFFFKGSQKEKKFLTNKKSEGYILQSINLGIYKFKKMDNLTHSFLNIEFSDKNIDNQTINENDLVGISVVKSLNFTQYTIIYSYIDKVNTDNLNIITETEDIESFYLKEITNKLYFLNAFTTLIFILFWFTMMNLEKAFVYLAIPIYMMFISWVIYFIINRKFSKRLYVLSDDGNFLPRELKIIIHSKKEQIDIDALKNLGDWRFITSKKNQHYYSLYTSFSEDDLINEISSYLKIEQTDINIVSNLGLFPIGYF